MNYIKNLFKYWSLSIIIMICLVLFFTLINYINLINYKTVNIILKIIPYIALLISSFLFGKTCLKKGWIEGIKFSIFFILIFVISNIILKNKFNLYQLLYYASFIFCSIIGSAIGINKKKTD